MASTRSSVDADVRRGVSRGGRATSRRRAPGAGRGDSAAVVPATTVVGSPSAVRPPRPKRIRTTFKYHELQLMKTYFELNHNPDNNDLKQLSVKTGLSKRVLQASCTKLRRLKAYPSSQKLFEPETVIPSYVVQLLIQLITIQLFLLRDEVLLS